MSRTAANRDDDRANALYDLYQQGHSLEQVAAAFGVTRQSVYKMFKVRGFALRVKPAGLPYVVFEGEKYTLRNTGYFGKTRGARTLLHRDVWEYHNGPILKGFDIHHVDRNKENNRLSNLELIDKAEHARIYATGNNQFGQHGRRKPPGS